MNLRFKKYDHKWIIERYKFYKFIKRKAFIKRKKEAIFLKKPQTTFQITLILYIVCLLWIKLISGQVKKHKVQKGETLWSISQKYGIDLENLFFVNHNLLSSHIQVRQVLNIPMINEKIKNKINQKAVWKLTWPIQGNVIKEYGEKDKIFHRGLTIESYFTKVLASGKGKVIFSDFVRGYGRTIMIQHKQKLISIYSSKELVPLVSIGEPVLSRQTIGYKHEKHGRIILLFHVWSDGNLENPKLYLIRYENLKKLLPYE